MPVGWMSVFSYVRSNGLGSEWGYLEELVARTVDDVCCIWIIDAVLVRRNADDGAIFAV